MEGYIITKGTGTKKYTGYRCATSEMEVQEGEKFIESLEGWSPFIPPPPPKTPQQKLQELTALIASLDYETQADLSVYTPQIATVLSAGQVEVSKILVGRIQTNGDTDLETLKQAVLAILEA
jgi:hypothetical protein